MARIVLCGTIVRYPVGGMTQWMLSWLVGMKRLGHEIFFVEKSGWEYDCYDLSKRIMTSDCSYGVAFIKSVLGKYGLEKNWCFVDVKGSYYGLSKKKINEIFRSADLYIDMEWGQWPEESSFAKRKVFFDGEPGWFQFKLANMIHSGTQLPEYDYYFTAGQLIGTEGSIVPTCGLEWRPMFGPSLFEEVEEIEIDKKAPFTTVMNWQSHKTIEYEGEAYGQKDIEFEKFIQIPSLVNDHMEVAVSGPNVPRQKLEKAGWIEKNADDIAISIDSYKNYIAGSKGEFTVVKNVHIKAKTGWYGERENYYLWNGRPVVLQETGFSAFLPCGTGLLSFTNMEEAVDAIDKVSTDYARHSRAAKEIAVEYFTAEKVLAKFLAEMGI